LQAALRPGVEPSRIKIDPVSGCKYSFDHSDHRQQDLVEARPRCPNGHEFTPENTRMKAGARVCRTCHREGETARLSNPDYRARKREADRRFRKHHWLTSEQKARKFELQRNRREAARSVPR